MLQMIGTGNDANLVWSSVSIGMFFLFYFALKETPRLVLCWFGIDHVDKIHFKCR